MALEQENKDFLSQVQLLILLGIWTKTATFLGSGPCGALPPPYSHFLRPFSSLSEIPLSSLVASSGPVVSIRYHI